MLKMGNSIEVMEILKNELPKCFKCGRQKLPLAIGIHESILEYYQNDRRFDPQALIKAFSLYCQGTRYLKSIIEGAHRIDINGNPVSTVKKSEASYALKILVARKAKKAKKEKCQENKQQMTGANARLSKIQKEENAEEVEVSLS